MTVGIVSCFSGVGGLEGSDPALAFCESDEQAQIVLRRRHPEAKIHDDIATFQPPKAEVILGGWPCQDISVAGNQAGLTGERSGLFYELLGGAGCLTIRARQRVMDRVSVTASNSSPRPTANDRA